VFWLEGLSDARMEPLTPWKMAKGSIDFALALENQGREFFRNGRRINGVLEVDSKLDDPVFDRLTASIRRWKNGQMPVLEEGLTYKATAANNTDSQFVELLKQRRLELGLHWHIPRSFVAEDPGPMANQENESNNLVKYAIRPRARRTEQAIQARLMTPDQRRRYTPKLNLDSLLRGDSGTQWKNAVLARTSSVMSVNDIRTRFFGLPRLKDERADDPWAPLNSNRAADTMSGGETAPHDQIGAGND
jgi:HK97 family phage portal protein